MNCLVREMPACGEVPRIVHGTPGWYTKSSPIQVQMLNQTGAMFGDWLGCQLREPGGGRGDRTVKIIFGRQFGEQARSQQFLLSLVIYLARKAKPHKGSSCFFSPVSLQ